MVKSEQSEMDLQIILEPLRSSRRFFLAMDHSACGLADHQVSGQIRWEMSYEKVLKKAQKSPIAHFGGRVLAHVQSQHSAQKLQTHASPQKSDALWLGKDATTGKHINSLPSGQILKTHAITRLVREEQFNVSEFKQFKIATHELCVGDQETSYERMIVQDLIQKFLLLQKNQGKFETPEDSDVVHCQAFVQRRLHQPRERHHNHFRQTFRASEKFSSVSAQSPPAASRTTSTSTS